MKRINIAVAVVIILSMVLSACAPAAPVPTAVIQQVEMTQAPIQPTSPPASVKVITVGVNSENPPWIFMDNGVMTGFEADIIEEFAKRAGYEIEYKSAPFATVLTGVQSGQWDVAMSSIWVKQERVEVMDFADPYYDAQIGLMAPTEGGITSFDQMKGKVFGSDTGSANEAWLQEALPKYGPYEIKSYDYWADAVMDLQAGRIDGVVVDAPIALYWIKQNPDAGISMPLYITDYNFAQALAFQKGSPLVAIFNAVQSEMKADGTLAAIHKKWFVSEPPADSCAINECPPYLPNEKPGMAAAEPVAAERVADPDGTITVAMETILENLDMMTNSTLNAAGIFEVMFDRLVDLDENVTLQPMVATSWTVSEDGKVWTFKLRDDVKFWDGTPLTAKDVKYTIERMQMDDFNVGNTNYLNNQFQFDKAVILDDYTIEIHTKSPIPALLYTIEEIDIYPEHIYSTLTPEQAGSEVLMGSGPFKFVEFKKDEIVVLERNDDYWGGAPAFKNLIYRQIPEASTRIAELETSGVDVIQSVPMAQMDTVNAMPNARTEAMINGCRMYLGFNHNNPKYQDKNVRLAMNHAINWEEINQAFFKGQAPRMVLHINEPWLNDNLEAYPFDLAKTDALMTESGWAKNANGFWEKDGQEFAPSIMVYYAQGSERYEILLSLVDQLRKAGFNADAFYLERAAAFEKLDNKTIEDMFLIGSCTSYEGQGDISDLAAASSSNYGQWNNAEFEALYAQLLTEFDMAKRAELLDAMQVIMYDEAPQIPLWILIAVWGISEDVDWSPDPSGRAKMDRAVKFK